MSPAVRATARARTAIVLASLGMAGGAFVALGSSSDIGAGEGPVRGAALGLLAAALLLQLHDRPRAARVAAGLGAMLALGALLHLVVAAATLRLQLLGSPSATFALLLLAGGAVALTLPRTPSLQAAAACAVVAAWLAAYGAWLPLAGAYPPSWSDAGNAVLLPLAGMLAGALVLAAGVARASGSPAADWVPAWAPAVLSGLVLLGWQQLEQREWREWTRDAALARDTIAQDVRARLTMRGDALRRLAERRPALEEGDRADWERDAASYLRDFPSLHAVVLANPQLLVRWRVARPGSPNLVGRSIWVDDGRLAAFEEAPRLRQVRLSPVIDLRSGGQGVIFVAPVVDGDTLRGFMTASLRVADLLEVVRTPALRDFSVTLRDAGGVVAGQEGPPHLGAGPPLVQRTVFRSFGQAWTLEVSPRVEYMARTRSRLPEAVLLLGALAVVLVSAALLQSRRAVRHSTSAEDLAARLTRTLESITDAFFTLDVQWRFTYVNAEAERLLQRSRASLLGRGVWDEFPQAVGSSFQQHYQAARDHGTTAVFEAYFAPLSCWFGVRAYPAEDGLAVYFQDVTEVVRNRDALRESEERFRLLARATSDAIWDCDLATGAFWCSDNFAELLGAPPGATFTLARWRSGIHPDDLPATDSAMQAALAGGGNTWSAEHRFLLGNGEWAHMLSRGYVLRDAGGHPQRLLCGMSDVTAHTKLEEQLRQSQRLESIGQLTGGVAHDFNNLLTVILGNAESLVEELASQPARAQLATMVLRAAERGADLTQRLLAFARRQPLAPQSVDVAQQLRQLEPLLKRTLGEHIAIHIEAGGSLWPALVDPAQLDNALLNLCLNARDAMPEGGRLTLEACNVTLSGTLLLRFPDLVPGEYAMLGVSDSGRGIAPENLRRVFEPFFTTKEVGKGTGLGLPMVYGFVKQSGGQVDIQSEPGRGTSVRLYLPRAPAEPVPKIGAAPTVAGAGEWILLVEDDALVRKYAAAQLRTLGYAVHEVADAQQALDLLAGSARVDLLFTDVVMPGVSGPQLVERARRLRSGLRVLYTSGYAEDVVVHHGRLDGGVDLLTKPYSREALARRVMAALRGEPASVG